MGIGEKVKAIRESMGMIKVKFALSLNVKDTYIGQIERGLKIPSNLFLDISHSFFRYSTASPMWFMFLPHLLLGY